MAQPRWAKSCGPSGTHVAPVPSVDEEMGTDLPHDEEVRGTSLPCKHTFSGWQAETCPCSNPHPMRASTFFPSTQQSPPSVPGIAPQCPAYGLLPPAIPGGTRRAIQRQICILSYKTTSSVEGQTCSRVRGSAPQAKSIWLGHVPAAATGGIDNNPVTLSIYTCRGFGPFLQALRGPRLRGPRIAPLSTPGSREIGVTLPTLQK